MKVVKSRLVNSPEAEQWQGGNRWDQRTDKILQFCGDVGCGSVTGTPQGYHGFLAKFQVPDDFPNANATIQQILQT